MFRDIYQNLQREKNWQSEKTNIPFNRKLLL